LTLSSVSFRGKELLGLIRINKKYLVYNDIKSRYCLIYESIPVFFQAHRLLSPPMY